MTDQQWRIEQDAADYFMHQQKKNNFADRRPVIRKPSDLVGPGIAASAIRITDFSDLLATYNGYYSALPGAVDAPNTEDSFVGITVMDTELGGWQQFRSVQSGFTYARTFTRNPTDTSTIYWSPWASDVPAVPDPANGVFVAATLLGAWVQLAGWGTVGYTRTDGWVELQGIGSSGARASTMFILPPGYRPPVIKRLPASSTTTSAASAGTAHTHAFVGSSVDILPTGEVIPQGGTGNQSVDGVIFRAAP